MTKHIIVLFIERTAPVEPIGAKNLAKKMEAYQGNVICCFLRSGVLLFFELIRDVNPLYYNV